MGGVPLSYALGRGGRLAACLAALFIAMPLAGGAFAAEQASDGVAASPGGFQGQHFSGTGTAVTGAKPESKLWWNDGFWWASMWEAVSQDNHIFKLNSENHAWVDTGVALDTRSGTRADTLWDGTHLYVASHAFTNTASSGLASFLYRYSYNAATDTYSKDSGFPVTINNYRTETLVIDKDSTGRLWATWVQDQAVYVNATTADDKTWGTPVALPVADASGLSTDDISSLIAFNGRIGVMWSNQTTETMYFAVHVDGDAVTTWQPREIALSGPLSADDHINLKRDSTGRVYAAVKTSKTASQDPLNELLVRDPATGAWSEHIFGRQGDHHTRPIVVIDEANGRIHMFATSGEAGGTVYEKTAPIANISFEPGLGTRFIQDDASADMNDATSTKQNLNAATGLVVMASNDTTGYFWHNERTLAVPGLAADFSGTPTSGAGPLTVAFTDTSSGRPTSWSWDFGDGTGSTAQNPTHTYDSLGSYTVSLTVSDGAGSNTKTRTNFVSVTPPPQTLELAPTGDAYVNSTAPTTNYGGAATVRVRNGGTTATAQHFRSYLKFTVSGLSGVSITSATLRLYVNDPAANGGTVYAASNSWEESAISWASAPASAGSALSTVGPAALDSWVDVSIPASEFATGNGTYTFAIESNNPADGTSWYSSREGADPPQLVLDLSNVPDPPIAAFGASPTAGPAPLTVNFTDASSGNATSWRWDFGDGTTSTVQNPSHTYSTPGDYTVSLTATNAGGSSTATQPNYIGVAVPPPPATAFTGSPTAGSAPVTVNFADTSTGNPTSWSWTFGDGGTSTLQNPSHTYSTPGDYTVSLTATNQGGSTTATQTNYVSVSAPPPPTTSFTGSPTAGSAPLTVNFTDTSTGNPTSWSWDFGDGGTSTLQNPTHTYSTAGDYTVSLTATNLGGGTTATRTQYIAVAPPPTTFDFVPTADAYVRSLSPSTNYGTAATIRVKNGGTSENYRSFLRFNVTGISVAVRSAKLRLYVTDPATDGGSVYSVGNGWAEGTLTWSNAPVVSGSSLGQIGETTTIGTWVEVTLPASSFTAGNGVYNFALSSSVLNSGTSWYSSRETTNPPQLVLGT